MYMHPYHSHITIIVAVHDSKSSLLLPPDKFGHSLSLSRRNKSSLALALSHSFSRGNGLLLLIIFSILWQYQLVRSCFCRSLCSFLCKLQNVRARQIDTRQKQSRAAKNLLCSHSPPPTNPKPAAAAAPLQRSKINDIVPYLFRVTRNCYYPHHEQCRSCCCCCHPATHSCARRTTTHEHEQQQLERRRARERSKRTFKFARVISRDFYESRAHAASA